ncbi:hypothetical protein [Haloarchaeobius litoreus]|uniref:Uncharacterized protein n=1 Tax=Haloarchaeobius litoreus TaxID=755306 RepID=A0ABD6DID7_9EURY|nr:hypothetical protein [Haloarchaeobius litoreus]
MRRRALCRSLVTGAVLLAGCSRRPGDQPGADQQPPQTEPPVPTTDGSGDPTTEATRRAGEGLSVGLETDETDDEFLVTAVVANNRESMVDLTLVAVWTRDGERLERARRVRLAAGATGRYEFTFERVGSISFEWRDPGASTSLGGGSRRAPRPSRR